MIMSFFMSIQHTLCFAYTPIYLSKFVLNLYTWFDNFKIQPLSFMVPMYAYKKEDNPWENLNESLKFRSEPIKAIKSNLY